MADAGDPPPNAGLLNYNWFHYTLLDGLWPLSISLLLAWMGLLFYLLASITTGFFVPGANKLSSMLSFSSRVAGVAFLAGCQGLPHVIAGGTAISFGSPTLGIGAMVGAGLINVTLVWAFVLFSSPFLSTRDLAVFRRPFYRDLSFVFLALLGTFFLLLFHQVKWWMALLFLGCYLLYLVVVFVGRCLYRRYKSNRSETLGIIDDAEELQELRVLNQSEDYPMLDEYMFIKRSRKARRRPSSKDYLPLRRGGNGDENDEEEDSDEEDLNGDDDQDEDPFRPDHDLFMPPPSDEDEEEDGALTLRSPRVRRDGSRMGKGRGGKERPMSRWQAAVEYVALQTQWYGMTLPQKIWFCVSLPVILVRNATVPIVGEDEWIFVWALVNPLASPLVVLLATHHFASASIGGVFPVWALLLCIGSLVSAVVFFTSGLSRPPRYYVAFVVGCLAMSLVWMYLISCELLDLVRLFGHVFGVSDSALGLTIMSWGISAGDVYSNLTLTAAGFRNMSLASSLSASSFTLLIGVGLSLLIKVLMSGGVYFVLLDPILDLGFLCFAASLFLLAIAMPIMAFKPTRIWAGFQIGYYVIFLIMIILFELHVIF